MVSTIGGSSLAQSLPARVEARKTQAVAPETPAPAAALDAGTEAATGVQSAQSAAARVGEQLDAQFDAARVQRAQDDAGPAQDMEGKADAAATDAAGAEATTTEASPAAAPAGGGVRASGGGGTSSSDSATTDYIAEADTNNDRKVSEEERIAYEKKQASAAEKSAEAPDAVPDAARLSRAQEVRQAYLPQETAGSQLDTSA